MKSLNKDRKTILAFDWSKNGVSYMLLQKPCKCEEVLRRLGTHLGRRKVHQISREQGRIIPAQTLI